MTRLCLALLPWAVLLTLPFALPARAATGSAPADYAARWPLSVPAGASVARLPLPADVLTRLQTPGAQDIRVFNAEGQAVPLALERSPTAASPHAPPPVELPALPIEGDASTSAALAGGTLSLRMEEKAGSRVVQLEVPASAESAAESAAPASPVLLGALVDARHLALTPSAVELLADWPAARPVTFSLHTSEDLRHWRLLGQATAYRHETFSTPARVALPEDPPVKGRYLRITWSGQGDAPVTVRGVRLQPVATTAVALPRPSTELSLPAPGADGALQWRLPFATPLAALDIRLPGPNTLMPLRVLARQQREQPWVPQAQHVAFTLTDSGLARHSPPLELGSAAWREWRLEPTPATPGFTAPPRVTAYFAPLQLVFVASGSPPFTLAAGLANAPATFLPLGSLMPGMASNAPQHLPAATLGAADIAATDTSVSTVAIATQPVDGRAPARHWLLWAVLLAGVAALGGMAWALMRQTGSARPPA